MGLLREWQRERVAPRVAPMDWVEHEVVLEVGRVEAQPLVAPLVALPVVLPELHLARDAVLVPADRAVRPELARAEAQPWGPTYRVIRRYPPRIEAWEPLVRVVAEARQLPWARRTKSVREVKKKR
jgi:hypothetical protein